MLKFCMEMKLMDNKNTLELSWTYLLLLSFKKLLNITNKIKLPEK